VILSNDSRVNKHFDRVFEGGGSESLPPALLVLKFLALCAFGHLVWISKVAAEKAKVNDARVQKESSRRSTEETRSQIERRFPVTMGGKIISEQTCSGICYTGKERAKLPHVDCDKGTYS
jgi:hypothetical protein